MTSIVQEIMKKAEKLMLQNADENPGEIAVTYAVALGIMCGITVNPDKTLQGMFQIAKDTMDLTAVAGRSEETTREIIERLMENRND
jgi:RNase P/RNase MRP subunit p30